MSAGDVHSILYRGTDPLKATFKPSYDPSKRTLRLRPGKGVEAPAPTAEGPVEPALAAPEGSAAARRLARLRGTVPSAEKRRPAQAVVIHQSGAEARGGEAESPPPPADMEGPSELEGDDDKELGPEERRARTRAMALQFRKEEESRLQHAAENESEAEDEDEEFGAEEEDLPSASGALRKPVFVAKGSRGTEKQRELEELERNLKEEQELQRLQERQEESKALVEVTLKLEAEEREAQQRLSNFQEENMPDDDDEGDAEEQFELWKIRELTRLKRDREERVERQKFLEEIDRRRNMTEEERLIDDARLDALQPAKEERRKYTFLQKYYHQGAFFQDQAQSGEEPLYLRDFNAPTAGDLVDRSALPRPMQVRRDRFGKVGQVKHTHLAADDTTDRTSGWVKKKDARPKKKPKTDVV